MVGGEFQVSNNISFSTTGSGVVDKMCIRDSNTYFPDVSSPSTSQFLDEDSLIKYNGAQLAGQGLSTKWVAVSYTHLDVYKRQVQVPAGG